MSILILTASVKSSGFVLYMNFAKEMVFQLFRFERLLTFVLKPMIQE